MKRRSFLKSLCPFTVFEEKITWGEFILMCIKSVIGIILFFVFYCLMIASAEYMGVID